MFKKIFGTSVKIDTRLKNPNVRQGELLEGEIYIKAEKDIEISFIDLMIHVDYKVDDVYHSMKLHTHRLEDKFYLYKKQEIIVPFEFFIPSDIPVTTNNTTIYIKTDANTSAEGLFERKDKDYINVLPHNSLATIFDILNRMNFKLSEIEFEVIRNNFGHQSNHQITTNRRNYLQEFDFKPTYGSSNRSKIDEFEISIIDYNESGVLLVQFSIEKKKRKLFDYVYNPDNLYRLEIHPNQPNDYYVNIIQSFLNKY